MKCELCHKADAKTAITREKDGEEEELYVCESCAKNERQRRQRMSQRTRRVSGLPPGVEMSVTEFGPQDENEDVEDDNGELEPPPFFGALMNAVDNFVQKMGQTSKRLGETVKKLDEESRRMEFPLGRVQSEFRIGSRIQLEGLYLVGELEPAKRALRALGMELQGVFADCVREAGHAYTLSYTGSVESAKRVVSDLLREEKNARIRLNEEMPMVFEDSTCRALALLKNCRLLSPAELFDMLSALRLAALEGRLEGITLKEIDKLMSKIPLDSREDDLSNEERDRVCAERANEIVERFLNVMLIERPEDKR